MAVARKRPAPEGACPPVTAAKKRTRFNFSKIEDYEMIEELGEGTFGVVTKARHRRTGEMVAVKWFRGGAPDLNEVVREGGCLAACRGHPSIVQIKDIASNKATGDLYLVMEFVGFSLRDWLKRPLSEDAARAFMAQLLSAAAKMHSAPMAMIHRDIKPENILVGAGWPGRQVKLCDFGSATPAKPLGMPYPEQRVGTLQYCSPEQLISISRYGTGVDMWALGCVMAELLTGVPLFTATTVNDMITEIVDLRDGIVTMGLEVFDGMLELSLAGREVLAGLLSFEDDDGLTATQALKHRWFTEEVAEPPAAA